MNSPNLITVIPVYNESANIESVVEEWVACLKAEVGEFQIILLNDGSKDNTGEVLARLAATHGDVLRVVNKANSGHGRTCRVGYDLALEAGAPWVFQIDSDGQCDPVHFHDFWTQRDSFDCIYGKRTVRDDGMGRVFVSFCCRLLVWLVAGTYIRDPNVPYRLIRAKALRDALQMVPNDFDIQNVALSLALRKMGNVRWQFIPIHFRARRGGENSINYQKIIKMGFNMLRDLRRVRRMT
jgi:glycosyltransferase involved in cell wall biosynthesis